MPWSEFPRKRLSMSFPFCRGFFVVLSFSRIPSFRRDEAPSTLAQCHLHPYMEGAVSI